MKDRHQEAIVRQEMEQHRLEDAMNRQETQRQRDEQLEALDQWLSKQEKTR